MKRKMFKKLMAASLTTVMAVSMAGCGNTDTGSDVQDPGNSTSTDTPAAPDDTTTPAAPDDGGEEVSPYTVLTDENGNVYDLGGMEIIMRDWWTSEEVQEPKNEYEEALLEYHEWLQETYNFTFKQVQISDWGSTPQDFVDYATSGGDENYIWILRDDAITTGAMAQGLMYDLATLDCLDFSSEKFQQNKTHEMYQYGDKIYCMYGDHSEPRDGMFFNKRLLEEANIDPESLYDMAAAGNWTWDAWTDIMDQVQRDTDNDGVIDVWGTTQNDGSVITEAVFSNGGAWIDKNANGEFVYMLEDPKTLEALEWWVGILNNYRLVPPEGAAWDYYKEAFLNGMAVFCPEQGYAASNSTAMFAGMEDDFGWIPFPKGPQMNDYVNVWSNNPIAIPACYDADKAWKIAFAWNLWTDPVPGYEGYDGMKVGYYDGMRDTRAVDETYELLKTHGVVNYAGTVPNVNLGPDFAWNIYPGCDVSAAIESIRDTWKAYIDEANASLVK